jgi:hypothetical protein
VSGKIGAADELAEAARAYFDGFLKDEAEDELNPQTGRGVWTGVTREEQEAVLRLGRALARFEALRMEIGKTVAALGGLKLIENPIVPPDVVALVSGGVPIAAIAQCSCEECRPVTLSDMRMVVCPFCGNKRCPRARSHRFRCTGSNEPDQTPEESGNAP